MFLLAIFMSLEIGKSKEMAREDADDMITGAGKDMNKLLLLKECYKGLINSAQPYTRSDGKIVAPNGVIPLSHLSKSNIEGIQAMDSAFLESMQYNEWMQTFEEGLQAVNTKIEQIASQESWGESLK